MRLSYIHNENLFTGKMTSLYWNAPRRLNYEVTLFCDILFFSFKEKTACVTIELDGKQFSYQ